MEATLPQEEPGIVLWKPLSLRQGESWLIKPLREHNDLAGQLRDALDGRGERRGRGGHPAGGHIESSWGTEQRTTRRDFAEVNCAEESDGGVLCVIQLVPTGFGLGDAPPHVFGAAIKKIGALPADGQPRPTV